MNAVKKSESIWAKIGTGVAVAMSVAVIWLMIDIRDFVKFRQPEKDARQDAGIMQVKRFVEVNDSMQCEKNKATQSRVDNMQDIARRLEFKIDVMLESDIESKRKIEEMSKLLKYEQTTKAE
jgi:uncharacterized membrane protein YhiD involved in acid resistance